MNQTEDLALWPILRRIKQEFLQKVHKFYISNTGESVYMLSRDDLFQVFGANDRGQLGVGHCDPVDQQPVEVVELRNKGVVSLAEGDHFIMALTRNGHLYGWGGNTDGQLGLGNFQDQLRPQTVMTRISKVSCGGAHTLMLKVGGKVYACGWNEYGQLGTGDTFEQPTPIQVHKLEPNHIVDIGCCFHGSVALTNDGRVFVWGEFEPICSLVPTRVLNQFDLTIKSVACVEDQFLLLSSNGTVFRCFQNERNEFCCEDIQEVEEEIKAIVSKWCYYNFLLISGTGRCFVWDRDSGHLTVTSMGSIPDAYCLYSLSTTPYLTVLPPSVIDPNRIKFLKFFNDPTTSDLTIEVKQQYHYKSIYVHREVLMDRSRYFRKTLPKENRSKFQIDTYSYPVCFVYFRYLYTDQLHIETDWATQLYILACEFEDDTLRKKCEDHLRNCMSSEDLLESYHNQTERGQVYLSKFLRKLKTFAQQLTVENCCRMYQLIIDHHWAKNQCNDRLRRKVLQFIKLNIFEVCISDGFERMNSEMCKQLLIEVSRLSDPILKLTPKINDSEPSSSSSGSEDQDSSPGKCKEGDERESSSGPEESSSSGPEESSSSGHESLTSTLSDGKSTD